MNADERISDFERDLSSLINRYSIENRSNTPDFMLAKYLIDCLNAFEEITKRRSNQEKDG